MAPWSPVSQVHTDVTATYQESIQTAEAKVMAPEVFFSFSRTLHVDISAKPILSTVPPQEAPQGVKIVHLVSA